MMTHSFMGSEIMFFFFFKSRLSLNGSITSLNSWSKLTQKIPLKFPTESCSRYVVGPYLFKPSHLGHDLYIPLYIYTNRYIIHPWKINGCNLKRSPLEGKEHHLNQTSFFFGGGYGYPFLTPPETNSQRPWNYAKSHLPTVEMFRGKLPCFIC